MVASVGCFFAQDLLVAIGYGVLFDTTDYDLLACMCAMLTT